MHTARRIRSEAYACSAPTCRSLILWSIVCRRAGQVALSWPLIDRGDSQTHVRSIHGSMILFAAGLRAAADVRPPAGHLIALSLYSSRTRRARVTSRVCLHVLDRIRCIQLSACIAARRAEECRCWRFSYRNFFFNKKNAPFNSLKNMRAKNERRKLGTSRAEHTQSLSLTLVYFPPLL